MVGDGSNARDAHLALIELAASICRPAEPLCMECPLAATCRSSQADSQRKKLLF
jgi:DNA (cytosine-5)-methyltransferase 1